MYMPPSYLVWTTGHSARAHRSSSSSRAHCSASNQFSSSKKLRWDSVMTVAPCPGSDRRAGVAEVPLLLRLLRLLRLFRGAAGGGVRGPVLHALVLGHLRRGVVGQQIRRFPLVGLGQRLGVEGELDQGAVRIPGVDGMDELVLDLGDVVAVVQPALLAALQPADVVAVEGDVVDPVGQAAAHPGLPRPGLDDYALDAAQVPDGEEPA